MFGLGFTEILLIAVLALLFIGPDKLPDTMKTIARTLGKLKRMLDDTKSTIEQELRVDELRQEVMQYRAELDKAKSDLSAFKNVANKEIESVKKSAQIESFKPTDINDDKLFDDLFEEAESDFDKLEAEKEEFKNKTKNLAKEAQIHLKELNKPNLNEEPQKEKTGFKHLDREDV
jgi:sec-independent protein translocase protein TatB